MGFKTEDLRERGLTDEQIQYVMAEAGKGTEREKALTAENEQLKTQLKDASATIEKFNGADIEGMQAEIEKWKKQSEENAAKYAADLDERDFNSALEKAIAGAKGLNAKAISALLDKDTLKASKNRNEDISKAIEALKGAEDSKMLFAQETEENKARFTDPNGNGGAGAPDETDPNKMDMKAYRAWRAKQ